MSKIFICYAFLSFVLLKGNAQNIQSPQSIIRHKITNPTLNQIINNKKQNKTYIIKKVENGLLIINKKTKEEYLYVKHSNSIETYTFYSAKSLSDIKMQLEKICGEGLEFSTEDDSGFIAYVKSDNNGSKCYLIICKKMKEGTYKISYSWECD